MDNNILIFYSSFTWGLFILLSFIGWGSFLKAILFPQKEFDWAQRAAWGVAWSVFIGGLLNIFCVISSTTLLAYIVLGIVNLFLFEYHKIKTYLLGFPSRSIELWRHDKIAFIGTIIFIGAAFFYYSTWIFTNLNRGDDMQAYAVFPQKMLEQGSMGPEIFNDRRTSALGGHSFLQALVLSVLTVRNLRIIDPGLAYFIIFGILAGMVRALKVPLKAAMLVLFFLILLPPLSANMSSIMMGLALFLAIFRLFEDTDKVGGHEILPRGIMIALLTAALCALKSNLIIYAVVFLIVMYLLRLGFEGSKKNTAFEGLVVLGLSFILLFPWMIASFIASGTLLYPVLGRGYHRSAYGIYEYSHASWSMFKDVLPLTYLNCSMFFVFLLYLAGLKNSLKNNRVLINAIFLSTCVGLLIMNLMIGDLNFRYSFTFFYASVAYLMMAALSQRAAFKNPGLKLVSLMVVILAVSWYLHEYFYRSPALIWQRSKSCNNLDGLSLAGRSLSTLSETTSYINAQRSIPAGRIILARCTNACLLDFKRNQIYVVDALIPGPKPGMPVFIGPEQVADYLLTQDIRYVLYSYWALRSDAKEYLVQTGNLKKAQWAREQYFINFKFQLILDELANTRKRVYDDKRIMVIDLAETS